MKLNKKGFTLVELLAVIVVLALLMVVAAGSIGTALENSKKSMLKTETHKLQRNGESEALASYMNGSTAKTAKYTFSGTDGSQYSYKIQYSYVNETKVTITSVCVADTKNSISISSTAVVGDTPTYGVLATCS